MDVYTNPQSTTYLLGKPFWYPTESGDVLAIAVPKSIAPVLGAIYTLLTIYLFAAIWNVLLYLVMFTVPLRDGLGWNLILSVYWNSAEPVAAWCNLTIHVGRMLRTGFKLKDRSIRLGLGLTILSLLIAVSGIIGGIFIPPTMVLGSVAPVNPEAVWVPSSPQVGVMSDRYTMLYSAATIRAVGSAEASKVILRDRVSLYQEATDQSTNEKPDFFITYKYNMTGVELGLRHSLGIVHSVRGTCWTEYGWLHHSNSEPEIDLYDPWNSSTHKFPVVSKSGPVAGTGLDLGYPIHPQQIQLRPLPLNLSYGLIYSTSHLPSGTKSNDAMYMTEMMPEDGQWSQMYPFRVKAERPVLSCWQTSIICVHGNCGSPLDLEEKGIPQGLRIILANLVVPMVPKIVSRMGPAALMSFYSPMPNHMVDAESSTAYADMERLVLGGYPLTRNLFRDSTMMEPSAAFKNAVLDDKGRYLLGTGDFVLESGSVTALSLQALITLPTVTLFIFLLGMLCKALARSGRDSHIQKQKRWGHVLDRLTKFATPNLYRVANNHTGDDNHLSWEYKRHLHPIPVSENDEMRLPLLSIERDGV